jgi:hypothetical protein
MTSLDKRVFEKLFEMHTGYILGQSNRTLAEFFTDSVNVDIYDDRYAQGSGSKANRLRAFWDLEQDPVVATALSGLLEKALAIVARLQGAALVDDLNALTPNATSTTFEVLARTVHDAIQAGEPEVGLDRLHTFLMTFLVTLAKSEGVQVTEGKPLHSLFGEVVKALRVRRAIETEMTDRILRSTISTFEAFNEVRNNRSLAHPNPMLSFEEALLIFRHVSSAVRFLRTVSKQ